MEYDKNWKETYRDMIKTPKRALSLLRSGHRVFLGTGCGEPTVLVEAMTRIAGNLADVEIIELLTKGNAPYAQKKFASCFKINSFFIGHNVRDVIQEGRGDYTPVLMSDIPRLFDSGQLPLDVALIQVTPPDERGKMSLGISVDIVKSAAENASLVIAQVNPQMPWTRGDSLIDIYDLDILVPADVPLLERSSKAAHPVSLKIAQFVAGLVPSGATVEFGLGRVPGVGRIPQAVIAALKDKHDLGIHTELITDDILDLIQSGAISGNRKSIDRAKVVASFCMGSKKLYDFIDDNPLFSFRPTEYVNDSNIIGKQNRMVSINMALEIDLTGQVCSDSEEGVFYSGVGGQVDFNRGAARSDGGRAIITIPSTTRDGKSRITARLSLGSGVVVSRATVHYVVSEYGVAYLHGKSVQDRTLALVSIAHPDHRAQLLKDAIEARYIRQEYVKVEGKFVVAPQDMMKATYLLNNGTEMYFRPIHPTDEPLMRDLLYDLSKETLYYRFMSHNQRFGKSEIQNFVYVDHRKDVAIVGTLPEAHGDAIVAVGRYYLDERSNRAEVAFVIRDEWQRMGLGSFMFKHLITLAKASGISGFTAEVLRENKGMQAIFNHSGYKVQSTLEEGVYSFRIEF